MTQKDIFKKKQTILNNSFFSEKFVNQNFNKVVPSKNISLCYMGHLIDKLFKFIHTSTPIWGLSQGCLLPSQNSEDGTLLSTSPTPLTQFFFSQLCQLLISVMFLKKAGIDLSNSTGNLGEFSTWARRGHFFVWVSSEQEFLLAFSSLRICIYMYACIYTLIYTKQVMHLIAIAYHLPAHAQPVLKQRLLPQPTPQFLFK